VNKFYYTTNCVFIFFWLENYDRTYHSIYRVITPTTRAPDGTSLHANNTLDGFLGPFVIVHALDHQSSSSRHIWPYLSILSGFSHTNYPGRNSEALAERSDTDQYFEIQAWSLKLAKLTKFFISLKKREMKVLEKKCWTSNFHGSINSRPRNVNNNFYN
jgi:hypothetical protein